MKALAVAPLVALSIAGCSSSGSTSQCAGGSTSTLTATVVDDSNESINLCNATVKASGPTQVTLMPTGGQGSCSYLGTVQAGVYTVTAMVTGYEPGSSTITVQSGCATPTTIEMTPAPP